MSIGVMQAQRWPQDHETLLRSLWGNGDSCAVIARAINEVFGTNYTRNAIIGKTGRIDLPGRVRKVPVKRATRPRPSTRKLRIVSRSETPHYAHATTIDDTLIPIEQRKSFIELADDSCRWPVGDVGSGDFFFCGGIALKDQPYCAGHCARAFDLSYRNVTRKRPVSIQSKAWGSYVAG